MFVGDEANSWVVDRAVRGLVVLRRVLRREQEHITRDFGLAGGSKGALFAMQKRVLPHHSLQRIFLY